MRLYEITFGDVLTVFYLLAGCFFATLLIAFISLIVDLIKKLRKKKDNDNR